MSVASGCSLCHHHAGIRPFFPFLSPFSLSRLNSFTDWVYNEPDTRQLLGPCKKFVNCWRTGLWPPGTAGLRAENYLWHWRPEFEQHTCTHGSDRSIDKSARASKGKDSVRLIKCVILSGSELQTASLNGLLGGRVGEGHMPMNGTGFGQWQLSHGPDEHICLHDLGLVVPERELTPGLMRLCSDQKSWLTKGVVLEPDVRAIRSFMAAILAVVSLVQSLLTFTLCHRKQLHLILFLLLYSLLINRCREEWMNTKSRKR